MRGRITRLLTAALVIAACGWTAVQGFGFVRFQSALDRAADDRGQSEQLAAWTAAPGLASLALEAQLRGLAGDGEPTALRKREDLLVQLLKIKPGASRAWLSLAAVRHTLAEPQDKIDAAFVMSGLTGSSEGALMAERSLLGVLMWERASPDVQARTLTDICGPAPLDAWKFRLIMTTKSDAVRAEIRAGMTMRGCPPALIKTVGL